MNIAAIIEENLLPPHSNRQGLSYGQLAILLLTYIISEGDHRLCGVEKWVNDHHQSLSSITGWDIAEKDATDDRCGDLLKTIGISDEQTIPIMETSLSKHLIRAYELPTEKARSDTTSFSVYHQPRPKLLSDWVKEPVTEIIKFWQQEVEESEPKEVGQGFEVPLGSIWVEPDTKKSYQWEERWLVVKSNALAQRQIKGLHTRLQKGEKAFFTPAQRRGNEQ